MEERFAMSAATGALGPVLVKLTALLGDEYKLQEGIQGDIVSIKSRLEPVHDLLSKLWGMYDLDVSCKDWMTEVRELSYDMEDAIDHFGLGLEAGDTGFEFIQPETTDSPFKKFMGIVKGVSMRCSEMQTIGDATCNRSKLTTDPRALFLHKDASELVGMEKKEEELIQLLHKHEMVCIIGFAGMGKTTLADLVYRTVGDQFQCRAFVSVHPSPNMTEILGTILSQVTNGAASACSGNEPETHEEIINEISMSLSGKRYLVIIDDVWHWEDWEVVREALPKNNSQGCKIIITTRISTIAEKCQSEKGAHVYTQKFDYEDAERLSNMRISKSCVGEKLEINAKGLSMSSKIVDMCDAMPLAVICLSSAWAESQVQGDSGEWDTWVSYVLDGGFLSTRSLKPLVQSLCLGFDDLPAHLRTCLLYCSTYPRDYPIERDCLVRKWIAEGFVSQQEQAEAYFNELISRNLLQEAGFLGNKYIVHPIMLAFLVCKAKEDNFVVCRHYNGSGRSSSSGKQICRRLCLFMDHYHPDEDASHTRSLVIGPEPQLDSVPLKKFENLRVLEIGREGLENGHLVDICGLIWLRYLGLEGAPITVLPREIGRLQNLETLDLRRTHISKLPKEIGKLQHLGALNISFTMVAELPREIGELRNLETLDASYTSVMALPVEIEKLQSLKVLNVSKTHVEELPREIGKLHHLEILDASKTSSTELPTEIEKLQYLKALDVSKTMVRELPKEIEKLQHLRTLNVSNTEVTELPREIEKLVHLRSLDISCTMVTELPLEITELYRLENLDVRNTGVRMLPKGISKLRHLRTLDIRGSQVRDLPWGVPGSLRVLLGDKNRAQVVMLHPAVSPPGAISSSSVSCREGLSIELYDPLGLTLEPLHVPMLRVPGRHMNVPQWIKQDLNNVCSLDIRLCNLGEDDLKFLQQMPNLQALALRFEVFPRAPIANIGGAGFSKLEALYVDCRVPQVITFEEGAMPELKHLEFKFYTGRANQDYSMGILHLRSLERIMFGCSSNYKSNSPGINAAIEVVRKEAAEHPNEITLWVSGMKPEVFGSGVKWISQASKAILQKEAEERERLQKQRQQLRRAAMRRWRPDQLEEDASEFVYRYSSEWGSEEWDAFKSTRL